MDKTRIAQLKVFLSMFVWGSVGIFVRNIPLPSAEIALYRAVLAVFFLTFYLVLTKQKIQFKKIKKQLPLLIISGIALAVNWIFLFEAYKYTTVSLATLSYYFAPVIVIIVCSILFKERLSTKQIFCFIMATAGLILIIGVDNLSGGNNQIRGIVMGLIAAVFYATVVLLNKGIDQIEGIPRTFIQFVAAMLILIPYVKSTSGFNVHTLEIRGFLCLIIVGLIHTGIAYCVYFSALKDVTGQNASMLSYIDPVVSVMLSVFILGEKMTIIQVIGGIMILGFTFLNEIEGMKKGKKE